MSTKILIFLTVATIFVNHNINAEDYIDVCFGNFGCSPKCGYLEPGSGKTNQTIFSFFACGPQELE
jgi:hypothetical protein